jgi:hypothetical protein
MRECCHPRSFQGAPPEAFVGGAGSGARDALLRFGATAARITLVANLVAGQGRRSRTSREAFVKLARGHYDPLPGAGHKGEDAAGARKAMAATSFRSARTEA